jgi:AraC-like DNA-binding protein
LAIMANDADQSSAAGAARVEVHLPVEALRGYVTFYYFVTARGPLTDFLYPEWGNVRFELAGEWRLEMSGAGAEATTGDRLFGPTDRCGRVATGGGRVAGFGLTPLGWHRLIGSDSSVMANRIVALGDALGSTTAALRTALAEPDAGVAVVQADALLMAYAATCSPEDPQISAVNLVLHDRPHDVDAFAAAAGVSTRTLHRICLRAFGFPPKRLLRRQRFLDTLGHVRTAVGDPLRETLDPDYFDQAHFYRDFRDFMGMSPRAYFTASRAIMANAAAAQAAAGVTLSFKLPPAFRN